MPEHVPTVKYADSTAQRVRKRAAELYMLHGSWRRLAKAVGLYSAAYWMQVAKGHTTPADDAIRALLQYDKAYGGMVQIPVCPTCSQYHGPNVVDCDGKNVEVKIVTRKEPARKRRPQAQRKNISVQPHVFERANAWRLACGLSWEDMIDRATHYYDLPESDDGTHTPL